MKRYAIFIIFLYPALSIFFHENFLSPYGLKFQMHVSDDDSSKFCKFDKIW